MQNKKYILQNFDEEMCKAMSRHGHEFKKVPPSLDPLAVHRLCLGGKYSLICDLWFFMRILKFDNLDYEIIINDNSAVPSEIIDIFYRPLTSGRSAIPIPNDGTATRWRFLDQTKFKYFSDLRDKILTLKLEAWTAGICGKFITNAYPNVTFKFKEHQVFHFYKKYDYFKHGESTSIQGKDKLFFYTINLRKERPARYKLLEVLRTTGLEDQCLSLSGSHHSLDRIKQTVIDDLQDSYHPEQLKEIGWLEGIPKRSFYRRTFIELACETLGHKDGDDTFWLTEKTIKPILMKHPFLVLAPMHHLKNLKDLGFKTFGDLIDESYDEMPKIDDRIKKIIDNLNTVKKDPVNFWNATTDIREHNHSILRDLLEKDKNSLVPFEDLI